MKQFFKDVPAEYDELHQVYARRGFRIIAAGYKALPALNSHEVTKLVREDIESELVFGGFVVFSSVLKPESLVVVKRLIESSHKVVMITGDNTLTACQVAKDLTMTSRPVLILAPPAGTFLKCFMDIWHSRRAGGYSCAVRGMCL
jgi:cation-transporting ATPase 13A1